VDVDVVDPALVAALVVEVEEAVTVMATMMAMAMAKAMTMTQRADLARIPGPTARPTVGTGMTSVFLMRVSMGHPFTSWPAGNTSADRCVAWCDATRMDFCVCLHWFPAATKASATR
jgi:hypothetical protein